MLIILICLGCDQSEHESGTRLYGHLESATTVECSGDGWQGAQAPLGTYHAQVMTCAAAGDDIDPVWGETACTFASVDDVRWSPEAEALQVLCAPGRVWEISWFQYAEYP